MREYSDIIIDNEAGFEHLARRTSRSADALLVISDATVAGLKAASRINELVKELQIKNKKRFLIINRYNNSLKVVEQRIENLKLDLDYIGNIPDDPSVTALKKLIDKIL